METHFQRTFCCITIGYFPVWRLGNKSSPITAHACHKRWLKWVPIAGGITGPPCLQESQIRRPGPPGWGLGVRPTTPPHKNIIVTKLQANEAGRVSWQWHEAVQSGFRSRTQNKTELIIDGVEEDARELGCSNWLAVSQDRSRWQRVLGEASAHLWL
jgi:hypothetical protein